MNRFALAAIPFSYSQTCDTSRPRRGALRATRRTGLGRTPFIDFFEQHPVRHRFRAEPVSKSRPGCVIDALRHPGFGEFGGTDVADHDVVELTDQFKSELVLEVRSGACHFGVHLGERA